MTADLGAILDGRYTIDRELGRGGMGVTYAATARATGEAVAIKRLDLRNLESWKTLELFEREARVLQTLDHPRVPRYVEHLSDPDAQAFYLVQALAPGRSLEARVRAGWRPSLETTLALAEDVLETLVYLQTIRPPVLHRDLKPGNIVWSESEGAALVDFGAVRDTHVHTVSGSDTLVGTFGYMAPEQLRGVANLTTDGYGLGTTLLYLITGAAPTELPQIRMRYDLSALALPEAVEAWLARLVEPAHEDRFPSALDALDGLKRALDAPRLATPAPRLATPTAPSVNAPQRAPGARMPSAALRPVAELENVNPLLGAPTKLQRRLRIPRELSERDLEQVMDLIQDHLGHAGRFEHVGRRFNWRGNTQNNLQMQVSVRQRDGYTEIVMTDNLSNLAGGYFGGIGGGVGGGVGGGMAAGAYFLGGVVLATLWVVGVVIGSLWFARWLFVRTARQRTQQFDALATDLQLAFGHAPAAAEVGALSQAHVESTEQV